MRESVFRRTQPFIVKDIKCNGYGYLLKTVTSSQFPESPQPYLEIKLLQTVVPP